ncbi:MAG: ATP-binding cassette domain-containing protein, partial [Actinobacteria bacterium]
MLRHSALPGRDPPHGAAGERDGLLGARPPARRLPVLRHRPVRGHRHPGRGAVRLPPAPGAVEPPAAGPGGAVLRLRRGRRARLGRRGAGRRRRLRGDPQVPGDADQERLLDLRPVRDRPRGLRRDDEGAGRAGRDRAAHLAPARREAGVNGNGAASLTGTGSGVLPRRLTAADRQRGRAVIGTWAHDHPQRVAAPVTREVLVVEDLSLRFGGVQALSAVDLRARTGEVTGVIGPNGAGKSTLFNCLSGLLTPDSGHVSFDGAPLQGAPAVRARRGLGRTFQTPRLFKSL